MLIMPDLLNHAERGTRFQRDGFPVSGMTIKEFLGYALGTAFMLAVLAAVLGVLVVLFSIVPLMLMLFPLTIAIVGGFFAAGYLRHRRARRISRS